MNKLILCLSLSLVTSLAFSQKIYFVYLQSESEQPFFVKVNEKVHSSTAAGYLILPRLKDSLYSISIGFPENKWPEQVFSININKKDRGYLLKNFGEKGWGLFDLQSLSVQMAVGTKTAVDNKPGPVNNDVSEFTEILSRAADDPSLKDKPVRPKPEVAVVKETVKKEEPVVSKDPDVAKPAATIETVNVKKEDAVVPNATGTNEKDVAKKEPVTIKEPVTAKPVETTESTTPKKEEVKSEIVNPKPVESTPTVINNKEEVKEKTTEPVPVKKEAEPVYTRSEVIKEAETTGAEGQGLVFIDKYDGKKDTIRLLIPNPKPLVDPVKVQPKEEKKFLEIATDIPKDEPKTISSNDKPVEKEKPVITERPAIKEEVSNPTATNPVNTTETKKVEPAKQPVVNACPATAGESDFLKLRKKMAAADDDDEMVAEARKYFKTTCFTVYQIRNLGTLFLGDEGKYKFFDAAYEHAADAHNFISLQLELKEEYYIKRFKAMLK